VVGCLASITTRAVQETRGYTYSHYLRENRVRRAGRLFARLS